MSFNQPKWIDIIGKPLFTVTPTADAIPVANGMNKIADGWLSNNIARLSDITWANLSGQPTTLAGYGITDAYTKTQSDLNYRPISYVPSWSEITSKPTTIAGFGITDPIAYTNVNNIFSVKQAIRDNTGNVADGLYAPWQSGDTQSTVHAGSSNASNNQNAFNGVSFSANGVYGESNTSVGVLGHAKSSTGIGVVAQTTSTLTGSSATVFSIRHLSSNTPSTNFGETLSFELQSSTTNNRQAAQILVRWVTATDASRRAQMILLASDNAANRVCLTAQSSGSAAQIGFLGASASVAQTGAANTAGGTYTANEQDMLQKAYNCLRTFGLLV